MPPTVFFQSGLPNQMPNFLDDEAAPFGGEEVPQLMDDDHEIEDQEDFGGE